MGTGLAGAIFWALDTVILSIAMMQTVFEGSPSAVFLAPFVSTFLHDFCSCIWMLFYIGTVSYTHLTLPTICSV